MKNTPLITTRPTLNLALTMAIGSALGFTTLRADSDRQASIAQTAADQASVQQDTVRTQTELRKVIEELRVNGVNDDLRAFLEQSYANLDHLSQQDMTQVITALKTASVESNQSIQQASVKEATRAQSQVSLKLNEVTQDIARHQSTDDFVALVRELVLRQSSNLRSTKILSDPGHASDAQGKTLAASVSKEQTDLGTDIVRMLGLLPAQLANHPEMGDSAKEMMGIGAELKTQAGLAAQAIQSSPASALPQETAVLRSLRILQTVISKNLDPLSRLQAAQNELNAALNAEKNLAANDAEKPQDKADDQAKVSDQAADLAESLKALNTPASKDIAAAQQAMDKSASELKNKPADAKADQAQAVAALTAAQQKLQEQIAQAEKIKKMSDAEKLAEMKKLQDKINDAEKDTVTKSADDAANEISKLASDASALSPSAADQINQAAQDLQSQSPSSQASAAQDLAKASEALQQQANQMAQDAKSEKAADQLANAEKQAESASSSASSSDLAKAADAIKNIDSSSLPSSAQDAVKQAGDAMQKAQAQASQGQSAESKASAGASQQALQSAQKMMASSGKGGQGSGMGSGQGKGGKGGTSGMGAGGAFTAEQMKGSGGFALGQVSGGLTNKDREAIAQYQAEKASPEFAPLFQQYLRNLNSASEQQ